MAALEGVGHGGEHGGAACFALGQLGGWDFGGLRGGAEEPVAYFARDLADFAEDAAGHAADWGAGVHGHPGVRVDRATPGLRLRLRKDEEAED